MKHLILFEEYIPFEEIKNEPSKEITATQQVSTIERDEPSSIAEEHYGKKGLRFINDLLDNNDGPVTEDVVVYRAIEWAMAKKTADRNMTYKITDPLIIQEVDMVTELLLLALKVINENGGKIKSSEPSGD